MTQNANITIFHISVFWDFVQKLTIAFFVFWGFNVITFVPIKIQTQWAPQIDHLNLTFVKDIHVDGKKLAKIWL
jgi:hypothetical protein